LKKGLFPTGVLPEVALEARAFHWPVVTEPQRCEGSFTSNVILYFKQELRFTMVTENLVVRG